MKSELDSYKYPPDIQEEDILAAMKSVNGYLDITPGDFKVLYGLAYNHAVERLTHSIKAHDIMTPSVISVKKRTPLAEVAQKMAFEGISGVPVLDDAKRVIGIISEKDFCLHMDAEDLRSFMDVVAQCLESKKCIALPIRHQTAQNIMTHPAVTVTGEISVSEVADIMAANKINRVPVTDHEGRLVGIIARSDMVQTSRTLISPIKGST